MNKKEFRRSPRRKMPEIITVSDAMTEEVVGRIDNLSIGGLLLMIGKPMVEDALYQFRFRLPGADSIDVEAGVHLLWIDRASSPGQSWAGFRFIALSEDLRERLLAWIDAPGAEYE